MAEGNSDVPQRLCFPHIMQFPWDNKGMMEANTPMNDVPTPFNALVRIESFQPGNLDPAELQNFKQALGCLDVVARNGPRSIISGCSRACSFATAYRLLDLQYRLLHPTAEISSTNISHKKFEGTFDKLNNWPEIVRYFVNCIEVDQNDRAKNAPASHSLQDFTLFLDSSQGLTSITMNFSLAVLHLRAMFEGSEANGIPDLPDKMLDLIEVYRIQNRGHFWLERKTPHRFRGMLQASVMMTPIVLLMSVRLDNKKIAREELLTEFLRIGSKRPAVVRAFEDRIWTTLFRLASDPNSTSEHIISALVEISASDECIAAVNVGITDPAYHAFTGREPPHASHSIGLPTVSTLQIAQPTPVFNDSAHERPYLTPTSDKTPGRLDSPGYKPSDYVIQGYASPSDDAHGVDGKSWEPPSRDIDMIDVGAVGDGAGYEEVGEPPGVYPIGEYRGRLNGRGDDVGMDGMGFGDSAGGGFGEGQAGIPFPSHQTAGPQREMGEDNDGEDDEGPSDKAHEDEVMDEASSDKIGPQREMEQDDGDEDDEGPSGKADEDEVMDEARSDKTGPQREMEQDDGDEGPSDEADQTIGEKGAQTDTEGNDDAAGEMDGADDGAKHSSVGKRELRTRSTTSSAKHQGKALPQPSRTTSRQGARAVKKPARSTQPKDKGSEEVEDEDDDMGAEAEANPGPDGGTNLSQSNGAEDEREYQEIAEGIWIKTPSCTLDSTERPKIDSNAEIDAYGATDQKVTFRIRVHDQDIHDNVQLLAKAVKDGYKDGLPLHVHPTAREESVFRLVTEAEFKALPASEVQATLRHRHIVIHGESHEKKTFKDGLFGLGGGLERTTDIQDQSLPSTENCNLIRRVGTLRDLLTHASSPTGNALNALDFPMKHAAMTPTKYASDAHALLRTAERPTLQEGVGENPFPTGDFRWSIVATEGAFHALHDDSNGVGTYISPVTGWKWWVIARPIGTLDHSLFEDTGLLLNKAFSVNGNGEGMFALEAILLQPGMTLLMRPNTLHAVYTPRSSVVEGGHFFATSTMKDTLAATFHSFSLNDLITNTDHHPAYASLRRLIDLFHCVLVEGKMEDDDPSRDHIPDPYTLDGLMDLLSTVSLGMLLNVIDLRTYGREKMNPYAKKCWTDHDETYLPRADRIANQYARGQCLELLSWVDDRVSLLVTSQGHEEYQGVSEFYRQLFRHQLHLLYCYKNSADQDKFTHSINFDAANVKIQLANLCKEYCAEEWETKEINVHISSLDKDSRSVFPFLDGITVKTKPQKSTADHQTLLPSNYFSNAKRLLKLGSTQRDTLYEAFSSRIKSEKNGADHDHALHTSRKRKKKE